MGTLSDDFRPAFLTKRRNLSISVVPNAFYMSTVSKTFESILNKQEHLLFKKKHQQKPFIVDYFPEKYILEREYIYLY